MDIENPERGRELFFYRFMIAINRLYLDIENPERGRELEDDGTYGYHDSRFGYREPREGTRTSAFLKAIDCRFNHLDIENPERGRELSMD